MIIIYNSNINNTFVCVRLSSYSQKSRSDSDQGTMRGRGGGGREGGGRGGGGRGGEGRGGGERDTNMRRTCIKESKN